MYKLLSSPFLASLQSVFGRPSGSTIAQKIKALFASSEQGAWYDPSDFTTLFQDSAGTTPVTAVEQQVGLMLDKRLGLVRGSELVTNGDFADASSWTFVGGAAWSSGTAAFSAAGDVIQGGAVVASGTICAITFDITTALTATLTVYLGGAPAGTFASGSVGSKAMTFAKAAFNNNVQFSLAAGVGAIDNISVKQIIGAHATQATAPARFTLKDIGGFKSVFLDGIDDNLATTTGGGGTTGFFLCQAIKPTAGAGALRTIWSDTGTNSGYKVQLDALNKLSFSAGNGTAFTTIASTATVDVGTTSLITVWDDGTNLNVQIGSAAAQTVARPVVTAGTAAFTIGKDNGAATSFFTGNLYPEVYRQGSGLTAAQRTSVQTYCKSKAGL